MCKKKLLKILPHLRENRSQSLCALILHMGVRGLKLVVKVYPMPEYSNLKGA